MYAPAFSPDGKELAFLKSVNGVSQVTAIDLRSGKESWTIGAVNGGDTEASLSLEERLRRERLRQLAVGVTSFAWLPGSSSIVFPQQGSLIISSSDSGDGGVPTILVDRARASTEAGSIMDA